MSQDEKDLVQRVSAMLLRELTEGGNRDLTTMRLDQVVVADHRAEQRQTERCRY